MSVAILYLINGTRWWRNTKEKRKKRQSETKRIKIKCRKDMGSEHRNRVSGKGKSNP